MYLNKDEVNNSSIPFDYFSRGFDCQSHSLFQTCREVQCSVGVIVPMALSACCSSWPSTVPLWSRSYEANVAFQPFRICHSSLNSWKPMVPDMSLWDTVCQGAVTHCDFWVLPINQTWHFNIKLVKTSVTCTYSFFILGLDLRLDWREMVSIAHTEGSVSIVNLTFAL